MAQMYEKVDSSGNAMERKVIGGTPKFDHSGDKDKWLKVEHKPQPPHDPSTQRINQTRTVMASKVKYDWDVIDLSADEQRDAVNAVEDLIEALIAKGVIARTDLRSSYGRT